MFCDGCGTSLLPNSPFCSHCGRRIASLPFVAPAPTTDRRVMRHLDALSKLWVAYGVLSILLAPLAFIFSPVFGGSAHNGWPQFLDSPWSPLLALGILSSQIWSFALAASYLILAWALHERRPWARIFAIVLGFVVLLKFPLGTALGIFTLWVFLPDRSRLEYQQFAATR